MSARIVMMDLAPQACLEDPSGGLARLLRGLETCLNWETL
jgi:hypothetical protein